MRIEPSSSPAAGGTNDPEPTAGTMRAMVRDKYGETEVLHLDEVPRPLPGDHDVLVRVAAAGLDRGAWHAMTGLPHLSRLIFGVRRPRTCCWGPTSRVSRCRTSGSPYLSRTDRLHRAGGPPAAAGVSSHLQR